MGNVDTLQSEIDRVVGLIDETNHFFNQPDSHLRKDFEKSFSNSASKIAARMSVMAGRGKIEEVVIGCAVLGAAWVGAGVIDLCRNTVSKTKARNMLAAYYQELAVKQGLLITEHQKIIGELKNKSSEIEFENSILEKRLRQSEDILQRIQDTLSKRTVW